MVKRSHGNIRRGSVSGREQTLISHVVDGEYCAGVFKGGIFRIDRAEQNWNQSRLPVVAVKNVGDTQDFRGLQNSSGEEGESFGIIGIVTGRRSIQRVAVEVLGVLDEIELHPALAASAHD